MTTHTEDLKKLLQQQDEHREALKKIVDESLEEREGLIQKIYSEEHDNCNLTFGQKAADNIAKFGGSWKFIILFITLSSFWMIYNITVGKNAADPYPFILLNLILSCLAAIQAPIILMSQNRKESRDEKRARNDYMVNLKAELENRAMERRLDIFLNRQFKELIEIQRIQIEKLDHVSALPDQMNALLAQVDALIYLTHHEINDKKR